MGNQVRTKATMQQRIATLVAGTQKHFPTGTARGTLTFGGVTYDAAALVTLFQGLAAAIAAVDGARAHWLAALQTMQSERAKVGPVVGAFQSFLVSTFGASAPDLDDFGMVPRKQRAAPTVAVQAVAVAKRAATRQARGTMGKKQRLAVKGNVTGVAMTPIVAVAPKPAASSAPTAPASTASPAAPQSGSAPRT